MPNLRSPGGSREHQPNSNTRKPSKLRYLLPIGAAALSTGMITAVATKDIIFSLINRVLDESALSLPPEEAIEHFREALLYALAKEFSGMVATYHHQADFCDIGREYRSLGEPALATKAFEQCKADMPKEAGTIEQIKVYSELRDKKTDQTTVLDKIQYDQKIRELLQRFIDEVLENNGTRIYWPDSIDDFMEAYRLYESPEKIKQTLVAMGDSIISQRKARGDNYDIATAERCYELASMDEDEIYLRLAKGTFGADKSSNASYFFRTAARGQCMSGTEDTKTLARSIAQQSLSWMYTEGAEEVLTAAGIDEKEIAGILAEHMLTLPVKYLEAQERGFADDERFLPSKYTYAKRFLQKSGMPDKEIYKTLAVQAEKDGVFIAAAFYYDQLGDTKKAQENYAKAAPLERDLKNRTTLFSKAGLKKEAQETTTKHKKNMTAIAEELCAQGDLAGRMDAARMYISIREIAKAKKIVSGIVKQIKEDGYIFTDDEIETTASLCDEVGDYQTKTKLLEKLVEKVDLQKATNNDLFRLSDLYRKLGHEISSEFFRTIARRRIMAQSTENIFKHPNMNIDEAIESLSFYASCYCGIDLSPQEILTMVARRFFEVGNFSNAAIAFHVLGDNTGRSASLQALEKHCKEDDSPWNYRTLADTYKAIGEEDLAKQYYLWAAQAYSEANQEYDSKNASGYKDAAECYVLAGENNPPTNNPALLACIQSTGEVYVADDSEQDEAHHHGAHKCVHELRSIINLTQEQAQALLGKHAESRGLDQEAISHYSDAGMLYDAGRVHAANANRFEEWADNSNNPHYYIYASGHYGNSGDIDGELRTSVKTLAEERRDPSRTSSSEVEELKRILALLAEKEKFYVQEFSEEE